jgi:hypothetical protein
LPEAGYGAEPESWIEPCVPVELMLVELANCPFTAVIGPS